MYVFLFLVCSVLLKYWWNVNVVGKFYYILENYMGIDLNNRVIFFLNIDSDKVIYFWWGLIVVEIVV